VIVIFYTTSVIRVKALIFVDDYGKYGEYQLWSGEIQWEEQFLSLAEKYERFFYSTMDLQDIIGNSEETQKMNDDELERDGCEGCWYDPS
jgi:hypothetical protein